MREFRPAFTEHTIVLPYNDLSAVEAALEANRGEVAAIILEPIVGNAGLILPDQDFARVEGSDRTASGLTDL